jgi:nitronate monooxygenase
MAAEITEALRRTTRPIPSRPAAPFAINQIVHKSNDRLEHDMELCAKYKVPVSHHLARRAQPT